METKQKSHSMNQLRKQCGYHLGINIESYGTVGGLCLWWKPCANVQVVSSSKNLIDTFIHLKNENLLFRASLIYGPPYKDEKLQFWEDAMTLGNGNDCPLICAEDFNGLLWAHDKKSSWSITRVRHLGKFMDHNCLIDIGYKGPSFTWVKIEDG